jgi:hypothetical protein
MMSEIIRLVPQQSPLADDTADVLRDYANKVESGEITSMVLACVENGEYKLMRFSSLTESLVLSDLLHDSFLRQFSGR